MAKLTKKEILLNIVVPIGTFLLGLAATILFTIFDPSLDRGVIAKNKSEGKYQKKVQELPSVESFLNYLHIIETKDTSEMWNHMTLDHQRACGSKENLFYWYYLTSSYDVKYVIPISEDHFYVFLRYEDDVMGDEVSNIKQFTNSKKLSELIKCDTLPSVVLSEIYDFLDSRFEIKDTNQVKQEIINHVSSMTMQKMVTQDWRFPMYIADKLKLKPKQERDRNHIDQKQGHYLVSEVMMEEEGDVWKVKKMGTIAMSRWR